MKNLSVRTLTRITYALVVAQFVFTNSALVIALVTR